MKVMEKIRRPQKLVVDGKVVNASDGYEAGLLRRPCRFRAFRVTGPGLAGRVEVPCDDLDAARFLLDPALSGGNHLVYASTSLETACITPRTLKVYDLQNVKEGA